MSQPSEDDYAAFENDTWSVSPNQNIGNGEGNVSPNPYYGEEDEFLSPDISPINVSSPEQEDNPPITNLDDLNRLYGWGGDGEDCNSPASSEDSFFLRNRDIRDTLQTDLRPSEAARKMRRKRKARATGEGSPRDGHGGPIRRPK